MIREKCQPMVTAIWRPKKFKVNFHAPITIRQYPGPTSRERAIKAFNSPLLDGVIEKKPYSALFPHLCQYYRPASIKEKALYFIRSMITRLVSRLK